MCVWKNGKHVPCEKYAKNQIEEWNSPLFDSFTNCPYCGETLKNDGIMKTGIERICAERKRQIEIEGWDEEHDAKHTQEEIARAGAYYALPEYERRIVAGIWPWSWSWCKPCPENRIRELEKAGALIAAEIDRIQANERV